MLSPIQAIIPGFIELCILLDPNNPVIRDSLSQIVYSREVILDSDAEIIIQSNL